MQRSDTGEYVCWAASETGLTRSKVARLSVDAPSSGAVVFHRSPDPDTFPAVPGRPAVSDVTNKSVRLAWRAPGNTGTSPLRGYVVQYFSHLIGQVYRFSLWFFFKPCHVFNVLKRFLRATAMLQGVYGTMSVCLSSSSSVTDVLWLNGAR